MKDRPGYVFRIGSALPSEARKEFLYIYSIANSVLKGSTYLSFSSGVLDVETEAPVRQVA